MEVCRPFFCNDRASDLLPISVSELVHAMSLLSEVLRYDFERSTARLDEN